MSFKYYKLYSEYQNDDSEEEEGDEIDKKRTLRIMIWRIIITSLVRRQT